MADQSRFFYGARNCRVIRLGNLLWAAVLIQPYLEHIADQTKERKQDRTAIAAWQVLGPPQPSSTPTLLFRKKPRRTEGAGELHLGLLAEFGMTPSSRSGIVVESLKTEPDP